MPTKSFGTDGRCRVEFRLPAQAGNKRAWLVGDFNGWRADATPMALGPDDDLVVALDLPPGRYRFRYYLGDERWENDWKADEYEANEYGGHDSVLVVEDGAASVEADDGEHPLDRR